MLNVNFLIKINDVFCYILWAYLCQKNVSYIVVLRGGSQKIWNHACNNNTGTINLLAKEK